MSDRQFGDNFSDGGNVSTQRKNFFSNFYFFRFEIFVVSRLFWLTEGECGRKPGRKVGGRESAVGCVVTQHMCVGLRQFINIRD